MRRLTDNGDDGLSGIWILGRALVELLEAFTPGAPGGGESETERAKS